MQLTSSFGCQDSSASTFCCARWTNGIAKWTTRWWYIFTNIYASFRYTCWLCCLTVLDDISQLRSDILYVQRGRNRSLTVDVVAAFFVSQQHRRDSRQSERLHGLDVVPSERHAVFLADTVDCVLAVSQTDDRTCVCMWISSLIVRSDDILSVRIQPESELLQNERRLLQVLLSQTICSHRTVYNRRHRSSDSLQFPQRCSKQQHTKENNGHHQ